MRSLSYTQYGLAVAIDRHRLRHDAHFVGLTLLFTVGAMCLLGVIAGIALAVAGIFNLNDIPSAADGNLLDTALYVFSIGPPAVLAAVVCRQKINPFAAHKRVDPLSFLCLLGIGAAISVLANYVAYFVMLFFGLFGVQAPQTISEMDSSPLSLAFNLFSTALLPGLLEEMVFRGYLLTALRRYGDRFAVVVTAMLFGLLHGNVLQIPFAFFLGLVMGYLVVVTGNIWTAIALHMFNNGLAVVMEYTGGFMNPDDLGRLDQTVTLALVACGAVGFLALALTRSPYLRRPCGGWTSLSGGQKWGAVFSSATFSVAVALMLLLTVFNSLLGTA